MRYFHVSYKNHNKSLMNFHIKLSSIHPITQQKPSVSPVATWLAAETSPCCLNTDQSHFSAKILLTIPWPWPSLGVSHMQQDTGPVSGGEDSSSVQSLFLLPPFPWRFVLGRTCPHTLDSSLYESTGKPGQTSHWKYEALQLHFNIKWSKLHWVCHSSG